MRRKWGVDGGNINIWRFTSCRSDVANVILLLSVLLHDGDAVLLLLLLLLLLLFSGGVVAVVASSRADGQPAEYPRLRVQVLELLLHGVSSPHGDPGRLHHLDLRAALGIGNQQQAEATPAAAEALKGGSENGEKTYFDCSLDYFEKQLGNPTDQFASWEGDFNLILQKIQDHICLKLISKKLRLLGVSPRQ